jgi:peptidoglycan hydrolase-like protein with peptidoglycan-binding domain
MGCVLTAVQQETIMHKVVLTAVALAALSVSAVAQQGGMSGQSQTGQQMQPQSRALPDSSQALADYRISPQQLSSSQVRAIQQALEERGDSSVRVNGEWGPDTEAAVKNFQKSENMTSQSGELDFPTILALGLDPLSFGLAGAGETTRQAPREDAAQQRMPRMPEQNAPHSGGGQVR